MPAVLDADVKTATSLAGVKRFVNKPYVLDELMRYQSVIEDKRRLVCHSEQPGDDNLLLLYE